MKNLILYIFLFCFLFSPYDIRAQLNVRSTFLSSSNGLKADYIRMVVQDPRGYIWMGATTGLIRYDGYSAELITPDNTENRRLMLDERIQAMEIWQGRFVWLMVRGNKHCCYDTKTDRFVDYTGNETYEEAFRYYYILDNGELWLSDNKTSCKVIRYDGNKFSSEKFPIDKLPKEARPELPTAYAGLMRDGRDLLRDNRGNLVVVSYEGEIWYICRKTNRMIHLTGIYNSELLRLNGSPRYSIITDKDGVIWISAYGNGLFAHNPKTGRTTHFINNGSNMSPIQTNYIIRLFEDKAGDIWACQENMGVAVLRKQNSDIERIYFTTSERIDHTNSIHLLVRVGGKIFIGNRYNGLKIADGVLGNIKDIHIADDDIVALCPDKSGNIWMGTRKNGVLAGKMHFMHDDNPGSLSKGKISDIACDRKGRMWVSLFDGGVDMAMPDGKGGYVFRHFFNGEERVSHPRKMLVDHYGNIWLCSDNGIYVFNPDRLMADPKAYRHYDLRRNPKETNEAHCITETSGHQVITGTAGIGIVVFDNTKPDSARLMRHYTSDDGLPNNNVHQVIEDREGCIWMGTDHGLGRFDQKTKRIMSIMPANTLQGNMFIENAACMLEDGRLAFGSRHGIAVINPRSVVQRKPLFRLRMTNIDINGVNIREYDNGNLAAMMNTGEGIELAHNENSLVFYFSDFEYDEGETSKFTYRLKGYDDEWMPMTTMHFATYRNLPPGDYVMEVKAQNSNGEWNKTVIQMPVSILPPLWRTWWAYLIYIVFITVVGYTAYRSVKRTNALRNRIKVEQQLTEFKMQFFTNISHEFRTPLTIIRGAAERMRTLDNVPADMKQPLSSMQKSSKRLLRMINQLLEFSKMHENKLHLAVEDTEVVGFVREIYSTFKDMAETKHISYQFTTNVKTFNMPVDRSYLDKIAYNLISNAFKYTPSHRDITVRVKEEKGRMLLIVEDTGIGITKEKQKELFERFNQSAFSRNSIGIGLHLTHELVRVHHGSIAYAENPKGGSIFTVALPADPALYPEEEHMKTDNAVAKEEEDSMYGRRETEYLEAPAIPFNDQSVLIVEDDSDVREYLVRELQHYFNIESANDGHEALEKIKGQKPDLVVTDALMPIMDGYELLAKIRQNSEWDDIPVIMLTALSSEADEIKGIKAGAEAYIRKPFSPNVLITRISKILEQRAKLKISYAQEVKDDKAAMPNIITDERDHKLREQMDAWLQVHLSDTQLSVDSFAESFGYGRSKFFKRVKELTGMTPNEYIRNARMAKAVELLADEHMTIAEVAFMVGFEDQYYFSKAFKQYYGMPPSQYRKGK